LGVSTPYYYINTNEGILCCDDNCENFFSESPEKRDVLFWADLESALIWIKNHGSTLNNPTVEYGY
jgi:hypothetical protein